MIKIMLAHRFIVVHKYYYNKNNHNKNNNDPTWEEDYKYYEEACQILNKIQIK